jgi:Ring finger domain
MVPPPPRAQPHHVSIHANMINNNPPPPLAAAAAAATQRRRSTRLQQQQQQQMESNINNNNKKPAAAEVSGRPKTKKARTANNNNVTTTSNDRRKPPPAASLPTPSEESHTNSLNDNHNTNNHHPCCTICMSAINAPELAQIDGCSHFFCTDCITEWSDQENSCPNCKKRFTTITNVSDGTVHPVTPRNQHSDLLETMLGQLASAHYGWTMLNTTGTTTGPLPAGLAGFAAFGAAAAARGGGGVAGITIGTHHTAGGLAGLPTGIGMMGSGIGGPGSRGGDTLHSLRLALTIQARTAALRVVSTQQQNSIRLQNWLARHQNGRSYANPIDITADDGTEVQVVD